MRLSVGRKVMRIRSVLAELRRLGERLDRIEGNLSEAAVHAAGREPTRSVEDDRPLRSRPCRQEEARGPWFEARAERLGVVLPDHRWAWEKVAIVDALEQLEVLDPGSRGLGFGVGAEPLVAAFAARGCEVVATDLSVSDPRASVWSVTGEPPGAQALLRRPDICSDAQFDALVACRDVDMTDIPPDLVDFDFCWSACALEHLGNLAAGLAFVEHSLGCLRPGGVAAHTMELNLTSEESTISSGPTVLYRRGDIVDFCDELGARGHWVAPLDFDPGSGTLDRFVGRGDNRPPELRVPVGGYVTTTFLLVVRRGP